MKRRSHSGEGQDDSGSATWLRDFLIKHVGEPTDFDALIGRGSTTAWAGEVQAVTIFERDRIALFREIVSYLTQLLGSEEMAANWLLHNKAFEERVKSSPYDYLSSGEFEALALLHDALEILVHRRNLEGVLDQVVPPGDLIPFGSPSATASRESDLPRK